MRTLLSTALISTLATTLSAQTEWVTNGSFTGALAPWTLGGGYSVNAGLETTWDTTGMGVSDSFGTQSGGQTFPGPYSPNTIEQQVVIVQGLTYEFRADASGHRQAAPNVANAHIGRIWVEVDNVEIARVDLGDYTPIEIKRAQVVGRFVGQTTGTVTLRMFFQRDFLVDAGSPRMNLDNVSLRDVAGPTYWLDGNRKIGTTVDQRVAADPSTLFATFVALGEVPGGIPVPGIVGLVMIDPSTAVTLGAGVTTAAGVGTLPFAVPNDPVFTTTPLYYQAVGVGAVLSLSLHFGCVFTQ